MTKACGKQWKDELKLEQHSTYNVYALFVKSKKTIAGGSN
jgi:hypothetical protein